MDVYRINKIRWRLAAWLLVFCLIFPCSGMSQSEDPVRELLDLRQQYRTAFEKSDSSLFLQVCDKYKDFYAIQDRDPVLAARFEKYFPFAAYKAGWCYFRLAELSGSSGYMQAAYEWFNRVPIEASDSIGIYAAYMAGESRLRSIHFEKYEKYNSNLLSEGVIRDLINRLGMCKAAFRRAQERLPDGDLKYGSIIRQFDADYEAAMLWLMVKDGERADENLEKINYQGALDGYELSEADHIKAVLYYSHAMVLLQKYFINLDSQLADSLGAILVDIGRESSFRLAGMAQADGNYEAAIRYYKAAADIQGIEEADYWLGNMYLIEKQFSSSRNRFKDFTDSYTRDTLTVARLKSLVGDARQKRQIMNIALGSFDSESLDVLDRASLRFLIQIAGSAEREARDRCLRALSYFFERAEGFSQSEIDFYKGVVQSLRADATSGTGRTAEFSKAAKMLSGIGGDYAGEAKYIYGRALSYAGEGERDKANRILRELITEYGSLRSAYYLAENYLDDNDTIKACAIYERIKGSIERADQRSYYDLWLSDAESRMVNCSTIYYPGVELNIAGIDELRVPDTLSVISYTINGKVEEELIQYEALNVDRFIRRAFAEHAFDQLMILGLPKAEIYPSGNQLGNSVFMPVEWAAGIDDLLPLDSAWDLALMLTGMSGDRVVRLTDGDVRIMPGGEKLPVDESGYYIKNGIPDTEALELVISHDDYFPLFTTIVFSKRGKYFDTLALTERVEYTIGDQREAKCEESLFHLSGLWDLADIPAWDFRSLCRRFAERDSLRDIVYSEASGVWLITDIYRGGSLWRLPSDGNSRQAESFALRFDSPGDSLICPQGLEIGDDGSIYIADWGNNRICVFDRHGDYIRAFGEPGRNSSANIGEAIRLTYPREIVIMDDKEGILFYGDRLYRPMQIFISDQDGIHICDASGRYLGTAVRSGEYDDLVIAPSSLYGFAIDGYGKASRLYTLDRIGNRLLDYEARFNK